MTDTSSQTEHQDAAPTTEQQPAEKTFTQADVDRLLGERLARAKEKFADYDDLKAAAAELKNIKDANKSESQKLSDQIAALHKQLADKDAEVSTLSLKTLRAEVAATKGVPAGRLQGTTKEEIEADAEAYLAELASIRDAGTKRKPPAPASGLKSGASSSGDTSANPQERAAAAVRRLRSGGD